MSSRCRASLVLLASLLAAGCERERREFEGPSGRAEPPPRLTDLQPGVPVAARTSATGKHYERNAYHIGEGAKWYRWFNCTGCHGYGGGAIGPALMDAQWRYGGSIDQIHASILDGRPNGMPAWRGKITRQQAWQLAAYVRSLSGNVPRDAAPGRHETLSAIPPPTRIPRQPPQGGDPPAMGGPQP